MGVFNALGRWIKAFGYLITGRINKASETLRLNPAVMSANYDDIIQKRVGRINTYKEAIAGLVTQLEDKKGKVKTLTTEIERLEKLKAGAVAMAKKITAKWTKDGTLDTAGRAADPEYMKCQGAFNDFSSTLAEKQKRVQELEGDIGALDASVKNHMVNIQSELRELDKLKSEKYEAVAEVMSAQEEQKIADLLTGLQADNTSQELADLRDLRSKAKAGAVVSRTLAGLDTKHAENEFLAAVAETQANSEFDSLVDGPQKTAPVKDGTKAVPVVDTLAAEVDKLPEK